MGHKPPEKTADIQKLNLQAFDTWLARNGKMILPIPNRAVIYAGYPESEARKARLFLEREDRLQRMWKIIDEVEKQIREVTGQVTYDKLTDVLKRLRAPLPELREATGANIGHRKKFSDMLHCAETLTDRNWQLIDKGKFNHVWDSLSAAYVRNSVGDVQIWEGRKANYKRIDKGTTLIRRELTELMARNDLPKSTLEAAIKIAKGYQTHYDGQKQIADEIVKAAEARLKSPLR